MRILFISIQLLLSGILLAQPDPGHPLRQIEQEDLRQLQQALSEDFLDGRAFIQWSERKRQGLGLLEEIKIPEEKQDLEVTRVAIFRKGNVEISRLKKGKIDPKSTKKYKYRKEIFKGKEAYAVGDATRLPKDGEKITKRSKLDLGFFLVNGPEAVSQWLFFDFSIIDRARLNKSVPNFAQFEISEWTWKELDQVEVRKYWPEAK